MKNEVFEVSRGMPLEIFVDKYARRKTDGSFQNWQERITEVVDGNFTLDPRNTQEDASTRQSLHDDYTETMRLAVKGLIPLSGRHLQHGDLDQSSKSGELFTNCSTSMFTFTKFLLLLKGSGVGRCYDSDAHWVDWDYMPNCRFVLSGSHPDHESWIETLEEAQHKYDSDGEDVRWFNVEDSAEGWVRVITILETAAFHKNNRDNLFIFNFTPVRARGEPIRGQQNRPSSGPVPLIKALQQVITIKGAGYKPWKQALFVDHYLSSCVAVGGVRRSARMATKSWRDRDVIDFIDVKRGGWLYTANNSITVDKEFWEQAANPRPSHGRRVFEAAVQAAYYDRTGEPGFINIDQLSWNAEGCELITAENFLNTEYETRMGGLHDRTRSMINYVLDRVRGKQYPYIVNPCAEIVLASYGGYCVVGDVCLAQAESVAEAEAAVHYTAQMLVRTNRMQFLYGPEVTRTNRIGTSLIGLHEFAANLWGWSVRDLLDETATQPFWQTLARLRAVNRNSARAMSKLSGMVDPHTDTCLKPAGTVAKAMNCTEAANLPSLAQYLRWIQFPNNHPLLANYEKRGYPVRDISHDETRVDSRGVPYTVRGYAGTSIVGFPTRMRLATILGDRTVCAGDLTLAEHFRWLQLLEKYWLGEGNNQISYTLKYDPAVVDYPQFMQQILEYQPTVRCCSIMPQVNQNAYIYSPEEAISVERYNELVAIIDAADRESVDESSLDCEGGACGVDFSINRSAADEALAQVA